MAERASERFVRLVGLVSFLETSGPVPVEDLARRFGVSAKQILADVDTLWISGTPGYWPEDLIDFDADSIERGIVHLTSSRGMTRPLRLGTREAITLIAALRAMSEVVAQAGDPEQAAVVGSALAKLTAASGEGAAALDVRVAVDASPQVLAAVTRALATHRLLRIEYVNNADVTSTRVVEPIRLLPSDDFTYLHAWCTSAHAERTFRTDRILSADVLPEHGTRTATRVPAPGTYRPTTGTVAQITFTSRARWIAEQVPVESVRTLDGSDFVVTLRVGNAMWLRHLLLRNAREVVAVDPPDVLRDVADAADRALAEYAALDMLEPASADQGPAGGAGGGAGGAGRGVGTDR
ncbi:helix-turn-helix transcriptional regulator [Sanguibacter antarcticus]|uniref:Proteasome accessory factor C n=1 Tax=Sanguibacter antarcticus TaxID=372484 RepID=A0A2A9E3C7_9MICO|nr:WYL domain-containing protein [Sanguibacter antarcticus]PFG33156.1 proteasome accessory factor C [Sanguibacter antarcticus]